MKTKLQIKEIADPDTNVAINNPDHEIWEIQNEIKKFFPPNVADMAKAEVFEMWEDD